MRLTMRDKRILDYALCFLASNLDSTEALSLDPQGRSDDELSEDEAQNMIEPLCKEIHTLAQKVQNESVADQVVVGRGPGPWGDGV